MIYLDNAATTLRKPECVVEAVTRALCSMGNPGRSAHDGALSASRTVFEARLALAELFGAESPDRIAFTANATEALNIAIKGILNPGDHVITTALEHNSVLRPLYEMEDKGVELTILPADRQGRLKEADFEAAIRANTRAIVCTHGSNLTGNLVDIGRVGQIARRHAVPFRVDRQASLHGRLHRLLRHGRSFRRPERKPAALCIGLRIGIFRAGQDRGLRKRAVPDGRDRLRDV